MKNEYNMLETIFKKLASNYSDNTDIISSLWLELKKNYINKRRHYHNLSHLTNVYSQLYAVKSYIQDWDIILFTLFYHDIVYSTTKNDNEKRSAEFAEKRMQQISIPNDMIVKCKTQILTTKNHQYHIDSDTNYFCDADLSILGQDWAIYAPYFQNVRKEFARYPNFLYNSGRKKALRGFLALERIFKTDYFFSKYEQQARFNINLEIDLL